MSLLEDRKVFELTGSLRSLAEKSGAPRNDQ